MKDVTALNKCSACGHVKRAHFLCPYCVAGKLLRECFMLNCSHSAEIQKEVFKKQSKESPTDE